MLQGIRASTLTMPSFGHNLSLTGVQKMDGYGDADAWHWPQQSNTHSRSYAPIFDPALYTNLTPQLPVPGSVQPQHHSIATSRIVTTGTSTPPPQRQQIVGHMVKAQPAFKPTWHGFLDSTKDAMTIVEAALQGRLSHISRRPHDKERAEMLTSGTILVYEENASGIKRWTDAVHWSPSRVMNNCLIYRQLVRALKPEEKKSALNPTCGGKRKRKESAGMSVTKTGDSVNNSDDEYDNPIYDGAVGETDAVGKVYANFAQTLTPDQQRRFCGSLIDSYEFKEGGLMKKTISVKYQGTNHHIISYYSLEDVVAGKLKRPCQDSKLADIQPRPELLTGWKVSLEDEESKDIPLVAGYSNQLQSSHFQHPTGPVAPGGRAHELVPTHAQLHLQVPDYWHSGQVTHYPPTHQSSQHHIPPSSAVSQYAVQPIPQQHPAQQPSPQHYSSQQGTTSQYAQVLSPHHYSSQQIIGRQYPQAPSPQHYSTQHGSAQHYPSPAASTHQYNPSAQQPPQQFIAEQSVAPIQHYAQQPTAARYPTAQQDQVPQAPQYAIPQAAAFDINITAHPNSNPLQHETQSSLSQPDPHRRASAPVAMPANGLPHYQNQPQAPPPTYYLTEHKYPACQSFGY